MPMTPPDLGPRYRLLRELGRGGSGAVYLVADAHLKKDLALKLLERFPAPPEETREIQREFLLLARIEHPLVARAHDFGYLGGVPFFTSEYVAGSALDGARLGDLNQLLGVARDVAEALAFLHSNEVLHLDLKPSNVILRRPESRAVLIDFGLCRTGIQGHAQAVLKGSLPYMAPEYFSGERLGTWTDVYAFGVTFYRLVTGRFPRPRAAGEPRDRAWEPPPPPSRFRPSLPSDLDHVLLDCLALEPSSRFASAADLLSALERIGKASPPRARPSGRASITIGKERELARADAILAGLRGGDPAAVLVVTAQPGMGQSHFLGEVKVRAQVAGVHAYLVAGYSGRIGTPGSLFSFLASHLPAGEGGALGRWRKFLARLRSVRGPALNATTESERRLRRSTELIRAIRSATGPVLLVVDGLQHLDEVSQELLVDLARFLLDATRTERPPFGVVLGYREEGPSAGLLRDLTSHVLAAGGARAITLGPLGMEESFDLHRQSLGAKDRRTGGTDTAMALYQETGGCPARIVALAGGRPTEPETFARTGKAAAHERPPPDLPSRAVLLALSLFGRPATAAELARVSGLSPSRVSRLLAKLEEGGLVEVTDPGKGTSQWIATAPGALVLGDASRSERRKLHARIASLLATGSRRGAEGSIVEAVSHFRLAGDRASVRRHGHRAARYLKSTFQNRAALDLYRSILEALPREDVRRRAATALEMAEIQARVGDFEAGIHVLRDALLEKRRLRGVQRLRALLTLAMLHARRGDFERADRHFREGLKRGKHEGSGLSRDDFLFFLNEHAAVKAFTGQYADALDLCSRGLRLASSKRSFRSREVALNLHATMANIALRRFDFDGSVRDFKRALGIAEAIGAEANQAVILNNLGLAYAQSDRHEEAVGVLREAEKMCKRLEEGPSLASIHGNLAIVHAKLGDFTAADRVLDEPRAIGTAGMARRQEFLLTHARGLTLLLRGRFSDAEPPLRDALGLAESMGDRHVAGFEAAYLAEALLFQGRYAEAESELERLSAVGPPGRVRKMALARLALLHACTARHRKMEDAVRRHDSLPAEPRVPYLDAWDSLHIGWALSMSGAAARSLPLLRRAETFFRERGLKPGLSFTLWVEAEGRFLRGDRDGAREVLSSAAPASDVLQVLWPLLSARLLLDGPATPERRKRGADLLAEAGRALVGNRLPEWACRLEALRAVLGRDGGRGAAKVRAARLEIAKELPEPARRRYLHGDHWTAWTAGLGVRGRAIGPLEGSGADEPAPASTKTVHIGEPAPGMRSRLVALSAPMRRLVADLDRLRGSDLPVLIVGETGAGKELVARALHEESGRTGPFRAIDLGSIPESLLESELFGARAGAFTDLKEDRSGLLGIARGGTVLFDEIAAATLEAQGKLLRAISEMKYRPIGAAGEETIEVRFLFATARDLEAEVRKGAFRSDLLHRIRVVTLRVPPLRERSEDLEELLPILAAESGADPPRVEPEALELLRRHPWPGNVRELENLLSRLRVDDPERVARRALVKILSGPEPGAFFPNHLLQGDKLEELKERLERDYILHHYRRLLGETGALSRFLGLSPRQLYRRADRLGISFRKERRRLGGE